MLKKYTIEIHVKSHSKKLIEIIKEILTRELTTSDPFITQDFKLLAVIIKEV